MGVSLKRIKNLLKREIKRFKVDSCADGTLLIMPHYRSQPIERGARPIGVMTRILIAEEIERLLNKAVK